MMLFGKMPSDHPTPTCFRCEEMRDRAARLEMKPSAVIVYEKFRRDYAKHAIIVAIVSSICVPLLVIGGGLVMNFTENLAQQAIGSFFVALFGVPFFATFTGLLACRRERDRLMYVRARSEVGGK